AAQDPHTQYAQKHNPTFTGEPKAPTPAAGNNTTRIATTAFVQAAITALINGAPDTLDTLKEIAAAINNDPKFSTTINNALSGKQPLDETLTHLSGKDVAGLLAYLGLGEGSALPVGVPVPWPSATPPTGWLKCNGAAFDKVKYPRLATAYPSGKLPDLRGEFIRGWDDGRGIDTGRALLSIQSDEVRKLALKYWGPASNSSPSKTFALSDSAGGGLYTDGISQASGGIINAFQLPGGNETRPRNVAFNYIVRAA
ncbi:phage tail protein, partial [Escherichia coli]|uniref:phage tail protein n=1 Tax=Escherichia coli TaxID=562 RepID=UPI001559CCC5